MFPTRSAFYYHCHWQLVAMCMAFFLPGTPCRPSPMPSVCRCWRVQLCSLCMRRLTGHLSSPRHHPDQRGECVRALGAQSSSSSSSARSKGDSPKAHDGLQPLVTLCGKAGETGDSAAEREGARCTRNPTPPFLPPLPCAQEVSEFTARAERYVGVTSGGMDQAISVMGMPGMAKLVDFDPVRVWRGGGGEGLFMCACGGMTPCLPGGPHVWGDDALPAWRSSRVGG